MNWCEIALNVGLAFLGVILALWYENLGSPKLIIEKWETTDDVKPNNWRTRFLHLSVLNKPKRLPFVPRQTAVAVHGTITFLDSDKNPITGGMPIRWDGAPEPIKYELSGNQLQTIPDPRIVRISRYMDIFPDERETLAVAVRIQGDQHAYGWTSESYFNSWRHPDYQLAQGKYYARLHLKTGSTTLKKDIPFINPAAFTGFDLL